MTKAAAKTSASTELKILQQQDFLPADAAARYLALRLQVPVSEATLWDLTLDQKVLLSVQTTSMPLVGYLGEVRGEAVAYEEVSGARAVINLDAERSIGFDLKSSKSQELRGVFDISACGGWRGIAMHQRDADEWAAIVNELPICYQDPVDSQKVWVCSDVKISDCVSTSLDRWVRLGFRRAALDAFVFSAVGKTPENSDEQQLSLESALKIFGGVLHVIEGKYTKTKLKELIHKALGDEKLRPFGGRTMDNYFSEATDQFDAAAADRMDASGGTPRK